MTVNEGEWTKQVHHCTPPEVPTDMDIGSEWTCHCGRIWVVDYHRDPVNLNLLRLIPKRETSTFTLYNTPTTPTTWDTLRYPTS